MKISLFDGATAMALAQILPLLLLALMVEMRRTELHRRGRNVKRTRLYLGLFFLLFGIMETLFVLSIDGHLIPTRPSDLVAGAVIFGLLWFLLVLSLTRERQADGHEEQTDDHEEEDEKRRNDRPRR